jgi:hypothetical protein
MRKFEEEKIRSFEGILLGWTALGAVSREEAIQAHLN